MTTPPPEIEYETTLYTELALLQRLLLSEQQAHQKTKSTLGAFKAVATREASRASAPAEASGVSNAELRLLKDKLSEMQEALVLKEKERAELEKHLLRMFASCSVSFEYNEDASSGSTLRLVLTPTSDAVE